MFNIFKTETKEERKPSDTLGSVTKDELLMVVNTYGYQVYKTIKEDVSDDHLSFLNCSSLNQAIDRIMTDRTIRDLDNV